MGFAEKIMEKAYSDINKRLNYFEQYKKEILAASNINYELRQKLMLVPQKYWDDFNQYLLKDPEFRKALSAANPKKEEKSKVTSKKKENDDFDFDDDDDEFNFDDEDKTSNKKDDEDWSWDDDEEDDDDEFNFEVDDDEFDFDDNEDDRSSSKEEQIAAATNAIINAFNNNEAYSSIDIQKLVYGTTNALKNDAIEAVDDCLADVLHNIKPSKDWDTLNNSAEYAKVFNVISVICEEIGKIINTKKINSFVNGNLKQYEKLFEGQAQIVTEAFREFRKRNKAKQNWKKAGNILGTILLSPLIGYAKMGQALDEYSSRPEVQEKRRIESIRYYCKFCGNEFKTWGAASNIACPNRIRYDKAKANLEGRTPPTYHGHMKYEGSQKSEYECKNCGKKYKTIWEMVNDVCFVKARDNKDKYNRNNKPGLESDILTISRHEPAL